MKRGGLATGLWLGAWAPAALIGVTDVAAHGQGLSFVDAAASVGLWLLLALPVALAAGLGGLLLARLRHSDRLLPRLVGVGFAVAAFAALALDLLDPPAAAGLGIVGVLVAGLTPRSRGMGGAATGPALVAALALWVAIAPLLAGALAPEGPARDGARPRRAGTSAEAATGSPTGGPRHVVLLVLDTQRVDHLGAYGSTAGLSPTFDRLAAESVLFERCYAPASWTVPSHASLFTGLYPRTHGASFDEHRWLDDSFETLAEGLARAGYRTIGLAANQHLVLAHLQQGFQHFEILAPGLRRLRLRRPLQILGGPARWMDEGAASARAALERLIPEEEDRPTFLFVNLLEPHWRYLPPAAQRARGLPAGLSGLSAARLAAGFYGPLAMASGSVPTRTREAVRALYAAEVRYQDLRLREILDLVDRRLGRERTLLIVTSDHGENLGEAGRWDHVFAVNDHLIHVPLLLRGPGLAGGRREPGLCQLLDLPATVRGWTGRSEVPVGRGEDLLRQAFTGRKVVFAEGDPFYGHLERMSLRAGPARDIARFTARLTTVSDGRFKLLRSSREDDRLYDLAADPDETRDVSHEHPLRLSALQTALARFQREVPPYTRQREPARARDLDATDRDLLESLGYLQP